MARSVTVQCTATSRSSMVSCNIALPAHSISRALELYVASKYSKVTPAASGKLEPLFIHARAPSAMSIPRLVRSAIPSQVKIAVDFLYDFVKTVNVDSAKILILTPYSAMVETIA
ncbi:hypothetical protein V1508DRAFT_434814 [Lipomyces doorenjongii]|uniref:uncharacterized protein n=1 Tax=Lipomyces doorenjongii TaxID=383834 RepID=UPI0034CE88FB